MALNENKSGDSSLRDWFSKSKSSDGKPGWVQLGGKYAGKPCAKQPGQTTKPKCGSSKMKRALSKDEEEAAFRRKNREDPNPDRKGKAINVKTEETNMTIDSSAHKVKQRREKMRALMQRGVGGERDAAKRKLGKTAELPKLNKEEALDEKCWKGYTAKGLKKKGNRMVPNCVPVGEEAIEERSLSKGEEKDKEKYVKGMKKSAKDFKARYGDDYKSVMYATATKMAKEEKEGDHEFEMARRQLATMKNAANRLEKKMGKKGEGNLKAWVQSKLTKAADYADTAADYVTNEEVNINEIHASAHTPHEVPSKNLKKLVSKAVKRIDTDVDGDTDHNDKAKGELGEFIPGVGNKRLHSGTMTKTAQSTRIKSVKEFVEESAEKRYCPKCEKMETKSECSYGPEYWEKNAKKQTSESAAWTKKEGQNKEGGLNEKGRKSYEAENPGSDLKPPQPKGGPRKRSFCARMSGMKKKLTSKKTANDPNSRINKSLRAWNC